VVTYVALFTDLAWPWYAAVGVFVSIFASISVSILLDGFQENYSKYTIKGQLKDFIENDKPQKENGWYLVPGKVDSINYVLMLFFVLSLGSLVLFEYLV
jgi:SSS family solute:Na+ symporter